MIATHKNKIPIFRIDSKIKLEFFSHSLNVLARLEKLLFFIKYFDTVALFLLCISYKYLIHSEQGTKPERGGDQIMSTVLFVLPSLHPLISQSGAYCNIYRKLRVVTPSQ